MVQIVPMKFLPLRHFAYSLLHSAVRSSARRALSTSLHETSSLKSPIDAEYFVSSCRIPPEKSRIASRQISDPNSPSDPDSALHFLRQNGLSEEDIRSAVSNDPAILRCTVEKSLKPNFEFVKDLGFSPSEIAQLIVLSPNGFRLKSFKHKIEFLIPVVGSRENLLKALKRDPYFLTSNLEKVIQPNISFLREYCELSSLDISRLLLSRPSVISADPERLKSVAQTADELGIPRGSAVFRSSLGIISCLTRSKIDEKIELYKSLGWSDSEVSSMITKKPNLLSLSEEKIRRNVSFLTKEFNLDLGVIARRPVLIMFSVDKRFIPRYYVVKFLQSEGLIEVELSFYSVANYSEKIFFKKFVNQFEDVIPGLKENYTAALAGKAQLEASLASIKS